MITNGSESAYQIWSEEQGRWLPALSIQSDKEMHRMNKIAQRDIYRVRPIETD